MHHNIWLFFACFALIPFVAALSVAFTATPLATGEKLVVEATNQVSAGISFQPRSAYKQVFIGAAATASPANILAAWNVLYGALIVGQKVFIRAWVIGTNGQASKPIYSSKVIS